MDVQTAPRPKNARTQKFRWRALSTSCVSQLLYEEGLSKLIPAHERLHGAESIEQILNFAVLVNFLGRTKYVCRNDLQRVRIRDAVTLKAFRFLAVKERENDSAWAEQLGQIRYGLFRQCGLQIIDQIPN